MLSESTLSEAMNRACAEARKWLGATTPNPPVGAVALDSEGRILATTAHKKAGDLHAEVALIDYCRAKNLLPQVHTICVTLEPCNHQGRTPPCTEAIIKSGVKHVAIGTKDPNPNVKGGGAERLRQAGIKVAYGVNEEECRQLIHVFAYYMTTGKPWITIKRAFDAKGSMIPPAGKKVFTSHGSLMFAHRLRKKADAILTGSGTILADDPLFTVREVPDFANKRRILAIMDRRRRVSPVYLQKARQRGLDAVIYQDITEAIEDLMRRGVRDILVEAGIALAQAMITRELWTIRTDIHHIEPQDRIETAFNHPASLPFDRRRFKWDNVLPD